MISRSTTLAVNEGIGTFIAFVKKSGNVGELRGNIFHFHTQFFVFQTYRGSTRPLNLRARIARFSSEDIPRT